MRKQKIYKLVLTALLSAMTCAATMVIQIPSPVRGYLNLGDCFVLLSGWLLGPFYGFLSAAIGSSLADVFSGYMHYAPATFIIKGIMALIVSLSFRADKKACIKYPKIVKIIKGAVAEIFMAASYFAYAAFVLGEGWGALAGIPGNLAQGTAGLVFSIVLLEIIEKINLKIKKQYK